MRCTTRSGKYQCNKDIPAGATEHAGQCEAEDVATPARFGPYADRAHSRAYLRGYLDGAVGARLVAIGLTYGVDRQQEDLDCDYRERIWKEVAR